MKTVPLRENDETNSCLQPPKANTDVVPSVYNMAAWEIQCNQFDPVKCAKKPSMGFSISKRAFNSRSLKLNKKDKKIKPPLKRKIIVFL